MIRSGRLCFVGRTDELPDRRPALMLGASPAERVGSLLDAAGWQWELAADGRWRIQAEGHQAASEVCQQMVDGGVEVHHLSASRPSLEDASRAYRGGSRVRTLARLLSAEWLKVRRSSALMVALLAPWIVIAALLAFALSDTGTRLLRSGQMRSWSWLGDGAFGVWAMVVLPLAVALQCALLAAIEHRSRGLVRLFSLGLPRWQIYAAKQLIAFLLMVVSSTLLLVGVLGVGWLLAWQLPEVGFSAAPPWGLYFQGLISLCLAACFLLAILTWVSLLRTDFVLPIGLGLVASISMLAVRSVGADLERYHPWAWPVAAVRGLAAGELEPRWAIAGAGGGLLFAAVASWSFCRREPG